MGELPVIAKKNILKILKRMWLSGEFRQIIFGKNSIAIKLLKRIDRNQKGKQVVKYLSSNQKWLST